MKVNVEIDIEEALDNLRSKDRSDILSKYVSDIDDDDVLKEELESRGYIVTEKEGE